jgi:hypothetical protein
MTARWSPIYTYHSSLLAFAPKLIALASLSREFELECSSACASDLILRGARVLQPGVRHTDWPMRLCLVQLPRGSLHCSIGTRDPGLLATTQDICDPYWSFLEINFVTDK